MLNGKVQVKAGGTFSRDNVTKFQIRKGGVFQLVFPGGKQPFRLFSWGVNTHGRTGVGTDVGDTLTLTQIGSDTDWDFVNAKAAWSFGVREGKLFAWGLNGDGRLGVGDTTNRDIPTQVGTDTDWMMAAGGAAATSGHSHGIRDGKLFAWGGNANFRTGLGTNSGSNSSPVQVGSDTGWQIVTVGFSSGLGIRDGKLFAWGNNGAGRTGLGTASGSTETPTQVGSDSDWECVSADNQPTSSATLGIRDGKLFGWGSNVNNVNGTGSNQTVPTQVGSDTGWTKVSAGNTHALGIRNGMLFSWGSNANGQTGLNTSSGSTTSPTQVGSFNDWVSVSAGNGFSLAIRDGKLYAWGLNDNGRNGLGLTSGDTLTPTQVGSATDWVTVSAGSNYGLGGRSA